MNNNRRTEAWNKRQAANQTAHDRPHPKHYSNGDEQKFRHKDDPAIEKCHNEDHGKWQKARKASGNLSLKNKPSYLMSFTKGLPHNKDTGLITDPQHYQYFVRAIDSGDPKDFRDTPLGPDAHMGSAGNCYPPKTSKWKSKKALTGNDGGPVNLRAWESQSAGLAYELEGPDAQAVTMPPHPKLGSPELTAEMAEVYAQALLRDVPFNSMSAGIVEQTPKSEEKKVDHCCFHCGDVNVKNSKLAEKVDDIQAVLACTEELRKLDWFNGKSLKLNPAEEARRRFCPNPSNAFRGITKGDDIGPYLSQFILIGGSGINPGERNQDSGYINYGAASIDQRVRTAKPHIDYMTTWIEWLDVQQAANVSGQEEYLDPSDSLSRRFIYTPRDLATYVHFDALYQAYLNACLILLGRKTPFDPGIPFQEDDSRDHQQGFAHFGGPHILSLVTEVATRALKAVRFQKYNVHRRCRPEVLAARLSKGDMLKDMAPQLNQMKEDIGTSATDILGKIKAHNNKQNKKFKKIPHKLTENYLLPMAFCEGSPMHPAYGAGHATVAGACVTILKAFFESQALFKPDGEDSKMAYVSVNNGEELKLIQVYDQDCKPAHLTVEGELNKLASNISIGRNWAGVHYFTDYYESLLMGEQIAIGILEEQKLMFGENFSMTVPLFNGDSLRI